MIKGKVLAKGMIESAKTSSGGNDHLETAITSLTGVVEDLAKQNAIVLKKISETSDVQKQLAESDSNACMYC
jgi:hypothetical protein